MRAMAWRALVRGAVGGLLLAAAATSATAQDEQGASFFRKGTFDGMTWAEYRAAMPEYFGADSSGGLGVADIPDIFGPGAVLSVGNVYMKVTNIGLFGNPYTNVSSDPSGQWPGASGVEYLNAAVLAVGAVFYALGAGSVALGAGFPAFWLSMEFWGSSRCSSWWSS